MAERRVSFVAPLSFRLPAAALLLAGAALAAQPAWANKQDDTLRMAYDQAPESVDTYFNNVRIGVIIAANVWDTLLYRDPLTNDYKGQLAKRWKHVADKTLEFEQIGRAAGRERVGQDVSIAAVGAI